MDGIMSSHINFDRVEGSINSLHHEFCNAKPFPYVVIDNFLYESSLKKVLSSIGEPDRTKKSSDYIFAKNKFENPDFTDTSDVLSGLREELLSDRFAVILTKIYGKELFVDPSFLGGGVHQGGEGSFLDMHADFSRHPAHREWLRELNILLYLNSGYEDAWGGHLDLVHAETREEGRISPIANRMVLMLTNEYTLHGYKTIKFPKGRYRTSLAAYAYSVDTNYQAIPDRSTMWKPEAASLVKNILAKISPSVVKIKSKFFGSSTERRARKK